VRRGRRREQQPPSNNNTIDSSWKTLELVNSWIRHAEAKLAATLAATGVTASVAYNAVFTSTPGDSPKFYLAWSLGLLLAAAGACGLLGLIPRTRLRKRVLTSPPQQEGNLIYFKDIATSFGVAQGPAYAKHFQDMIGEGRALGRAIALQIHANSHVATRKTRAAHASLAFLSLGIAVLGITITASALWPWMSEALNGN
jgi:hypothetical protein